MFSLFYLILSELTHYRYTTNKRTLTVLEDTAFGLVGMVCVGSTMVGSIELTSKQGHYVKK